MKSERFFDENGEQENMTIGSAFSISLSPDGLFYVWPENKVAEEILNDAKTFESLECAEKFVENLVSRYVKKINHDNVISMSNVAQCEDCGRSFEITPENEQYCWKCLGRFYAEIEDDDRFE